jgi:acetyltransferase-like isoleucine patch superfamily enzyme
VNRDPVLLNKEFPEYDIGRGTYGASLNVYPYGANTNLKIGHYCSIAADVEIMLGGEHRFDFVTSFPFNAFGSRYRNIDAFRSKGDVIIGSDVWIGRRALILSGVTIGHGAVIAAGSIVTKDIPPYAIVGGNPAQVLKMRFSQEQINALLHIAWWDWPEDLIIQRVPQLMDADVDSFIKLYGGTPANDGRL